MRSMQTGASRVTKLNGANNWQASLGKKTELKAESLSAFSPGLQRGTESSFPHPFSFPQLQTKSFLDVKQVKFFPRVYFLMSSNRGREESPRVPPLGGRLRPARKLLTGQDFAVKRHDCYVPSLDLCHTLRLISVFLHNSVMFSCARCFTKFLRLNICSRSIVHLKILPYFIKSILCF